MHILTPAIILRSMQYLMITVYPSFAPGVPQPPATLQWSDIQFVVGGYGWKANFVNSSGNILTNGNNKIDSQYNCRIRSLKPAGNSFPMKRR